MMRWTTGLRAAVFCGLLVCGFGGGRAMEKQGEKRHVEVPAVAARPEDVNSIEGIVKASYETISGGVGVPRQWGRDRTLFAPSVRYISFRKIRPAKCGRGFRITKNIWTRATIFW